MRKYVAIAAALCFATASAQSRADLASRFGPPRSEVFLLPDGLKLTATYNGAGNACEYRIETAAHGDRSKPLLNELKYWMDSRKADQWIAELVPQALRKGPIHNDKLDMGVAERMVVEYDDTVEITRMQRWRGLLQVPDIPTADRLVKIRFLRAECGGQKAD